MTDYPYLSNTTADVRLIGIPNILSSFSHNDSAPRVTMLNHHLPQAMIIKEPEMNKTFTGFEEKFIDYTFNSSKRDRDCEILEVIPKYRAPLIHRDVCPQFYVIVLTYEPNGERVLDYFTVDRYFMGANGFGFIPEFQNIQRIQKGAILEKNTTITHSPAVKDNQYCLGTNLNTVYGSFPETIEDAFIISESAAKRLQTTQIQRVVINCRQDRRPLNLNGDEYEDKFLPDIGSTVGPEGQLCAFRPVHWTTIVADSDPAALREALPLQDEIIYIPGGSKIVDITFNINHNKRNNCYDQARHYEQNNTKCWEDIYNTYLKYKGKANITLSPKMSTLVTTSIYRMIAQGAHVPSLQGDPEFRKVMRNFDVEGDGPNGSVIDFMQVIVTYTLPRLVSNGTKLTDLHGAKGVVGHIYPDDWMPVDGYGIRADLWIDMNSPVSRNNPGQLYETGVNRIQEFVRRKCKTVYEVQGPEAAFETLMEWYGDVNPNYAKLIREHDVTPLDRKRTVEEAIQFSPRVWIPPFLDTLTPSKDEFWNALINIKKWADKWDVKPTPIRYKSLQADGTGKEFITEELFHIGSKYVLHLHKIPEIFAPGPAAVNHIGVPTKSSSSETKHYPVTVNPYRFGEDELRVMAMDSDPREVTRFQNLGSNSPTGVTTAIKSILLADNPTRIKRIPISNGELFETNAVLQLVHSTTAALGFETKVTNDVTALNAAFAKVSDMDRLADSIWQTEIVNEKDDVNKLDEGEGRARRATAKRGKVQKMIDSMDISDDDDLSDDDEGAGND